MDLKWGILILLLIFYVKGNNASIGEDESPFMLKLFTLGIDSDSSSRLRRVASPNCGSSNSEMDGGDSDNSGCAFGNWGFGKRSVRDKRLGWGNRAMEHGRKRSSNDRYIILARLLSFSSNRQ